MRTFLKWFLLLLTGETILFALVSCSVGWAAGPEAATVIGEETLFTWQAVVFMVTNVAGWAGVLALMRFHYCNDKIHLDYEAIALKFPPRTECDLRHEALEQKEAHRP